MNNPAKAAFDHALNQNIHFEKIHILSMGTGSYIPDPLNPEKGRGKFFWAKNIHKFNLSSQEGDTDTSMCASLKERYNRWQVWYDYPVKFDDFSEENLNFLLEMGN